MASVKMIFLLWAPKSMGRDERTRILLEECAPLIDQTGAERIVMYITDPESKVRGPAPKPLFERLIAAQAEVWADRSRAPELEALFTGRGFRCAAYLVEESVYREYGGNRHMRGRDWPDGTRSPGVVAVTLLTRPPHIGPDEWLRRWHGVMSPVSEEIQPRARYVRNLVLERMNAGAPAYDGIVIEAWPSPRHVSNPFLFYGAESVPALVKNMLRILRAVRSFLKIRQIRTVMMGEYFVKTTGAAGAAAGQVTP